MTNGEERSFDARLAVVEHEIAGVDTTLAQLVDRVGRLSDEVSRDRRTNWPVLLGCGTLTVAIVSLLGGNMAAPMKADIMHLQASTGQHAEQIRDIDARLIKTEVLSSTGARASTNRIFDALPTP